MAKPRTPKSIARRLLPALAELHPDAKCGLDFHSPFQLLIATILSAQCTDKLVNTVTPGLFARYPGPADFAAAALGDIESAVKKTGFYRNKAKNIQACCRALLERFGGVVPSGLEELTSLPGVGRKTANVVRGDAFGLPGITVDTHVGRLSRRLGLTAETDPVKAEFALMKIVPEAEWTDFSHRLIFHGRRVCFARKPDCAGCGLDPFCPKLGVSKPAAGA